MVDAQYGTTDTVARPDPRAEIELGWLCRDVAKCYTRPLWHSSNLPRSHLDGVGPTSVRTPEDKHEER